MANYWSASLNSFCRLDVLGDAMPDDAVELSGDVYLSLLSGQESGKSIATDSNGLPCLQEPPAPSTEQLQAGGRYWRDKSITATDPLVVRHRDEVESGGETTLTAPQYSELQAWRLDLRRWPESAGFPAETSRPIMPDWLASQLE